MSKTTDKPVCHRADDMVAYLYGEASATEAADFASHMSVCAACRTEFTLLTDVRESMSQWRAEVLGVNWTAAPLSIANPLPAMEANPRRHLPALAALREFFAISPLWLRGATALATVLFCLLAVLFGARMLRTPEQLYTKAEVDMQVQRQLDQLQKQGQATSTVPDREGRETVVQDGGSATVINTSFSGRPAKAKAASKSSRRFLTRAEREQLAADLRLKPATEEEDLTFLLGGGSN